MPNSLRNASGKTCFGPTTALALSMAICGAGCGGEYPTEGDQAALGDDGVRSAQSISGCFKHRTRKRTTRRTALHRRATAASARIRRVPKGATVRLWDRNHDGRVCPQKSHRSQRYAFYSVKYAGKVGWIKRKHLRRWAEPAYVSRCSGNCGNCVRYARCRQHGLPSGLFTYRDKVRIINSKRAYPRCIAIIKTSHIYGHVAYVYKVSGRRIYLSEANWARSCPSTRSGTKSGLNITGFWCP